MGAGVGVTVLLIITIAVVVVICVCTKRRNKKSNLIAVGTFIIFITESALLTVCTMLILYWQVTL